MAVLSSEQIQQELEKLPQWRSTGNAIERQFEFASFAAGMDFVNRVAALAEKANHHPDINIRYTKILVSLTSHDSGGITRRDIRLATEIDAP